MTAGEARIDVGTKLQLRPERPVRKPRPRLAGFDYKGRHAYHVVLTVKARSAVFEDIELGRQCVTQLMKSAGRTDFEVKAYCLMPDHAHLLAQGLCDDSDLVAFVRNFKQRTAFHFKQESGDQLWQQSYFDRVLRNDEHLGDVAAYVFQNPVAAGLCVNAADYPLSGGTYFDGASADRAEAPSLRGLSFVEERNDDD
jgi:REP element-mobilizing transposase RayT